MATTQIYDTNEKFDFSKINISKPISLSSGVFILKFTVDDIPLYINPPKCSIKIGQKGGKRTHCDFIFSQDNDQFIHWIENLEKMAQDKIYDNRTKWFESELEKEDIENYFTSPLKIYKSGKYYILRTNLPTQQKQNFKIYDENENEIQFDAITESMQITSVLEVQGIRCSSSNFQIDLLVKQMMVLQPVDLFEKCILNKRNPLQIKQEIVEEQKEKITTTLEEMEENTVPVPREFMNGSIEKSDENEVIANVVVTNVANVVVTNEVMQNEYSEEIKNENDGDQLCEVDFDINDMDENDAITIKQRNEMYYEMYTEARRKAKIARDLALSAYLEARRIKNTYMLEDILDSSDESDIDELEQME